MNEETRKEILREYYRGMRVLDIADKYEIPVKTVYRIINQQRAIK